MKLPNLPVMFSIRCVFVLILLATPLIGLAQTEEDKKEMKALIARLEKGEAGKKIVIVKLDSLQEKKSEEEKKYYENAQKLDELAAAQPKWDSVTITEDDKGNVIDKKFHPKPGNVVQWEANVRTALAEHYSIMDNLENLSHEVATSERDKIAAEQEIRQAKKLILLKEKYFKILKMVYPDQCGMPPGPEANVYVIKAYWDCVFDGTPVDQPILDTSNIKPGPKYFNSDAVVVPEYNKKEREEKERKIEEMIRQSTAPVKKPIIIPPPSPDQTKVEPTATERLKNALKNFLPKTPRKPAAVTSVRG